MYNAVGKWLGSRQIRCNWAAKGAGSDDKQNSDTKSVVELTNGTSGEHICSSAIKFWYCWIGLILVLVICLVLASLTVECDLKVSIFKNGCRSRKLCICTRINLVWSVVSTYVEYINYQCHLMKGYEDFFWVVISGRVAWPIFRCSNWENKCKASYGGGE